MRITDRSYTVLDMPLSSAQFWTGVAICGALVLAVLFALRPMLSLALWVAGLR